MVGSLDGVCAKRGQLRGSDKTALVEHREGVELYREVDLLLIQVLARMEL